VNGSIVCAAVWKGVDGGWQGCNKVVFDTELYPIFRDHGSVVGWPYVVLAFLLSNGHHNLKDVYLP
jgi:hypothetical protein